MPQRKSSQEIDELPCRTASAPTRAPLSALAAKQDILSLQLVNLLVWTQGMKLGVKRFSHHEYKQTGVMECWSDELSENPILQYATTPIG
jgi:hypothetical protein